MEEVKVEAESGSGPGPGFGHSNGNGNGHGYSNSNGAGIKVEEEPSKTTINNLFSPGSPKSKSAYSPKPEFAPSPSPGPSTKPALSKKVRNGKEVVVPTLIGDLPTAWDEAHETFDVLEKCVYETKMLGASREQDEMMICDCVYDKRDPDAIQCDLHSDCVNRAIFIECLPNECRARQQCRNQRFTKREYGPVEIVLTPMKGYGLRATEDIPSGTLIYEYIGEVVAEKTFRKRMQQYAEEGIRHFYFMMLQKEEYIDATKKGGIGRFANHSCNPNSEVQKWVVGRRLRMGIFTKRDVLKDEEITFNYNVDRYGHDAQICYCGEANCVGTIGGKTQTDIGGMTDLFIEALGIGDDVDALELKGSKKKKARQLDDIDYVPILKPIVGDEPQKVAAAMRQSMENTRVLSLLLQRIKITDDVVMHRQLMRMHGFSLMSMILTDLATERNVVLLVLAAMNQWKLQERNKVEDSKIEDPVKELASRPDPEISELATKLINYWSTLELSYKIPRVPKMASLDEEDDAAITTIAEANSHPAISAHHYRRPQDWENNTEIDLKVAPVRFRPPPAFARPKPPPPVAAPKMFSHSASSDRLKLDAIIALAQQSAAAAASASASLPTSMSDTRSPAAESSRSGSRPVEEVWEEEERAKARERERERDRERRKKLKRPRESAGREEDERKKEKRLTKLVGDVVVRSMSKYKSQMEHETFKRYAKECTGIVVEKEKKGHTYSTHSRSSLSEDKRAKIKVFTKEFTHKILKRLKEKGQLIRPSSAQQAQAPAAPGKGLNGGSSSATSTPADLSISTPNSNSNSNSNLGVSGHGTQERTLTSSVSVAELQDDGLVDDIFGASSDDDMEVDDSQENEGGAKHSHLSPAEAGSVIVTPATASDKSHA